MNHSKLETDSGTNAKTKMRTLALNDFEPILRLKFTICLNPPKKLNL
jgi:hypothetical protein